MRNLRAAYEGGDYQGCANSVADPDATRQQGPRTGILKVLRNNSIHSLHNGRSALSAGNVLESRVIRRWCYSRHHGFRF